MISRFLLTAVVLAAAGCGAGGEGGELEYAGVAGEPVVVELGGAAGLPLAPLPDGAVIAGERLEWTPTSAQEGEHLLAFEAITLRVSVAPADTSVEYGGCECGSRPNPPRPKAEALGVLLLAAWFRQKRRSA